jgi:hypothetical protein
LRTSCQLINRPSRLLCAIWFRDESANCSSGHRTGRGGFFELRASFPVVRGHQTNLVFSETGFPESVDESVRMTAFCKLRRAAEPVAATILTIRHLTPSHSRVLITSSLPLSTPTNDPHLGFVLPGGLTHVSWNSHGVYAH